MKAAVFLSLASAAITSAAGTPQVCASLSANCDATILCADVTTTGACASLPIPAALVGAVGSGTLYHKASMKGNAIDATLYSTPACDAKVGESFLLPLDACTLVPNMTLPIYVKAVMVNAPGTGTDVPSSQPPATPSASATAGTLSPTPAPPSATPASTSAASNASSAPTSKASSTATSNASSTAAGATTTPAGTPSSNAQKGSDATSASPTFFVALVAALSVFANSA